MRTKVAEPPIFFSLFYSPRWILYEAEMDESSECIFLRIMITWVSWIAYTKKLLLNNDNSVIVKRMMETVIAVGSGSYSSSESSRRLDRTVLE